MTSHVLWMSVTLLLLMFITGRFAARVVGRGEDDPGQQMRHERPAAGLQGARRTGQYVLAAGLQGARRTGQCVRRLVNVNVHASGGKQQQVGHFPSGKNTVCRPSCLQCPCVAGPCTGLHTCTGVTCGARGVASLSRMAPLCLRKSVRHWGTRGSWATPPP